MDNEKQKTYRENGILEYEQVIVLRRKMQNLMNEFSTLGAELDLFDDDVIEEISDKFHESFLAMSNLQKILNAKITAFREKFCNVEQPLENAVAVDFNSSAG